MHLSVAGERVSVRQMGPDFLIIEPTEERAPTVAQLYLSVDGRAREWEVFLPDGIAEGSRRIAIAKA